MSDKIENDILKTNLLVAQYSQVAYDRRYYDQAAWQIPSIALTVTSVVKLSHSTMFILQLYPELCFYSVLCLILPFWLCL